MKYAIIGCGRISANHIKAALSNNLEISAVCDIMPERTSDILEKHGLSTSSVKQYTSHIKMLEETRPNLVAIATESGSHAKIAMDCLDYGANIIVEKPIAMTVEDADLMIEKAVKKGLKACACHQNRFNESVIKLREAVLANRFGKLSHGTVHIRWAREESYYKQAPWRGTALKDGGALMNQSIHGIDLLCWLMGGEIEQVFAYTSNRFHNYIECEDIGVAVIKFKNGALGTIEGTTNVYPKNLEETLYIFGEKGTVKLGGKSANTIELWKFSDFSPCDEKIKEGFSEQTENVYGNGHIPLYADMLNAIKNGGEPYIGLSDGRQALKAVLAIYESAKKGAAITIK